MNYREYGRAGKDTIILLHGGGLSWWNFREEAEILQDRYHLILPVLDGHAGADRSFTSIEDNAAEIIAFIDEKLGGHVALLGGLSLGAQVALEILAERSDIASCALIESAAVLPSKLTNALIGPAFGSSYGLIKNRSFARAQFRSLHIKEELFEDYYRDTCLISKENMIAFMKANTAYTLKETLAVCSTKVFICRGEKENSEIRRSADLLKETFRDAELYVLKGLCHGEYSLNHADEYADDLERILQGKEPKGYNK